MDIYNIHETLRLNLNNIKPLTAPKVWTVAVD